MTRKKITRKEFLKSTVALGATAAVGVSFIHAGQAKASCMRPPGARPEEEFLARCIQCRKCSEACPNQCITTFTARSGAAFSAVPGRGQEGTPVIFPRRQACSLCTGTNSDYLLCTEACPSGALQKVRRNAEDIQAKVSMGRAQLDLDLCYSYTGASCGVCVRACPFEGHALKAGMFERPILNPAYCVGCGLCERACIRYPQAITVNPNREVTA